VIVSHGVWQRAFGAQDGVVGRKIALDHAPGYEITGVAPAGFDFPRGVEVYRSIGGFTNYERRTYRNVVAVARLRPEATLGGLRSELAGLEARLAAQYPETNAGLTFEAVSFRDLFVGEARPYLLVLLGAVGFVLLVACSNVTNLLLARALSRGREMAVRAALGAGRGELVAQLLAESAVLSLLAAALGLLLAGWWMRLLRAAVGLELPAWMAVELDGRVLAFSLTVALAAGLLSGLAPALHFVRPSLAEGLNESARGGTAGRTSARLRDGLVALQVGAALVLLAGGGLLLRGFGDLMARDKGFRADGLATFRVALGWKRYGNQESIARYYERAEAALSALPGVSAVALVTHPPLARQEESVPTTVQAEGQPLEDVRRNPYVVYQSVSEGYFGLLGIPLVKGRAFGPFDGPEGEPVAIVSARLAEALWPGRDPLGQRLRYDPLDPKPDPFRTVVGVVGDVRHASLSGESSPDLYVPFRQWAAANQYLLARTPLRLPAFQAQAERALWAIDPEQSLFDFQLYEQRILDGVWALRLSRRLMFLFGVLALALAAVGVYAVLSHAVGERTREIGIRLALGATPESVRRLVAAHALGLGALGLGAGLLAALGLGRLLARVFPGVPAADPTSVVLAGLALGGVTFLASVLPARRASRSDPLTVLRRE
jgi:putative ABC transport system permease protein